MGPSALIDSTGKKIGSANPLPTNQGFDTLVDIFEETTPGAATGILAGLRATLGTLKQEELNRSSTTLRCTIIASAANTTVKYTKKRGAKTLECAPYGISTLDAKAPAIFDIPVEPLDEEIDVFSSAASGTITANIREV